MALLNTTCPQCGAPHARKLSVIYSEGLSTLETTINTTGTFNTIGRQTITTEGTSTGTQQTQASRDASPPSVPPLTTSGMQIRRGAMVIGIAICIFAFVSDVTGFAVIGILAILGSFFVPTAATEFEQREHAEKNKDSYAAKGVWERTFQCGACGDRFIPAEAPAV